MSLKSAVQLAHMRLFSNEFFKFHKFGRKELDYIVSRKQNLQEKSINKAISSLHEASKQLEETNSRTNFIEKIFNDFQKEMKINETKELREAEKSKKERL